MSAPASGPESFGPRRTAQGTLVGMPPVVPDPARAGAFREGCSTTLRSVYSPEAAPCSDAFHPERWSNPPATGLSPIVPYDGPEEDEDAPAVGSAATAAAAVGSAQAAATSPDLPEPPTERWQPKPVASPVADEPIILPFREREPAPGRRLLVWAFVSSAVLVLAGVTLVLLFA